MADIIGKITAYKREEIAYAKALKPLRIIAEYARSAPKVRPFANAIEAKHKQKKPALITEIKKPLPSKGLIRTDFDLPALAKAYEAGGAACLSVLTDRPSLRGTPELLTATREATSLPVLRKDFMIDTYQVAEARAWGSDCILIILAEIDDATARDLTNAAKDWKMDAIVEVRNTAELERALKLDCRLVSINNRNLKTFDVKLKTTEDLALRISSDRIVISENGVFTPVHLLRLAAVGINTFLVGESLIRQVDVVAATKALLEAFPAS